MKHEDDRPVVAFFRPADEREKRAVEAVRARGMEPLSDPLLETRPTGAAPRTDADYVVVTSATGARIVADARAPDGNEAVFCAIGPRTADALRERGVEVGVVPETYSSAGLVVSLSPSVEGARVEVARSDHGSDELLDGLNAEGAYAHETVLYEITRPEGGGRKTAEALRDGALDAVLFTSSLTVEHLVGALDENGVGRDALDDTLVCAIGEPTRETAEASGVGVDFVSEEETFESLADAAAERLV